ncbi:hypothetical protein GOB93_20600 [Acetobacter musti]|uniref:Uncharacterized protein n=1 Tax=Acetobacter musti TaxID=864732 RepID=A0ABX0JUM4_9PROT|nr:hypothetical protein [Acetobacter musti]NHN86954.1 hypothetical protein [Acetobacter musti]
MLTLKQLTQRSLHIAGGDQSAQIKYYFPEAHGTHVPLTPPSLLYVKSTLTQHHRYAFTGRDGKLTLLYDTVLMHFSRDYVFAPTKIHFQ